jgi:hypothetical protein
MPARLEGYADGGRLMIPPSRWPPNATARVLGFAIGQLLGEVLMALMAAFTTLVDDKLPRAFDGRCRRQPIIV